MYTWMNLCTVMVVSKLSQFDSNTLRKIMDNYVCKKCGYVYEPAEGDSKAGIEPGLPFASLPEDWHCPQCNAERSEFDPEQGVMPGMVAPIGSE
jgi:rubredoxin